MIECEICGRSFKSAAGLSGHKQLAHGSPTARVSQEPDIALSEILGAVHEGIGALRGQVDSLKAQLDATNQRIADYRGSTTVDEKGAIEKINQALTTAKEALESELAEAKKQLEGAKTELSEWQNGKRFHAFDEGMHEGHEVSGPKLEAYVERKIKEHMDSMTDDQVRDFAIEKGVWPMFIDADIKK